MGSTGTPSLFPGVKLIGARKARSSSFKGVKKCSTGAMGPLSLSPPRLPPPPAIPLLVLALLPLFGVWVPRRPFPVPVPDPGPPSLSGSVGVARRDTPALEFVPVAAPDCVAGVGERPSFVERSAILVSAFLRVGSALGPPAIAAATPSKGLNTPLPLPLPPEAALLT